MPVRSLIGSLPKAELHVHLEGAMRPELLLELAAKRHVALPADDVAGLRRWFRFRDFEHFVEIYLACSKCLQEPEDFDRLLRDFALQQKAQNVVYSEVHFTVSTHRANGVNVGEVGRVFGRTLAQLEREEGLTIRLIPDIVRNLDVERADWTLDWAIETLGPVSVGLGLSGIEGHPIKRFADHFDRARQEGLRVTAHAGEQAGAEAVWEVLEIVAPERIGHGRSAAGDPQLMKTLKERSIPLEVCPTSNVCLNYVEDTASHPLGVFLEAGLALSINSDDPPLFGTDVSLELERVAEAFSLGEAQVVSLARSAFVHSFARPGLKEELLSSFDRVASASSDQD